VDEMGTSTTGCPFSEGRRSRMGLWLLKNRKELKKHLSDPLFKNAYFLMFFSLTSAGSGFFFWLIAARFYPAVNAGIASAIISATGLISMPSLFMVLLSRLYKYGYNPLREISL